MDSIVAAAARALAAGDPLGALKRVALRDDPPALALRGIALAQLGEYPRARGLLRRAARGFGAHEPRARARCVVAEAEIALAMRDLGGLPRGLGAAAARLEALGDRANARLARLLEARRLLLLGRVAEAEAAVAHLDLDGSPPTLVAIAALTQADVALRGLRLGAARDALRRAEAAARAAGVPALRAEAAAAQAVLERPAAQRIDAGQPRALRLDDVAALLDSGGFIVDACRRTLRVGARQRSLARRPLLFALLRTLAEAAPLDVARDTLIARLFRTRRPDASHRARLRVEAGRLRALLAGLAQVEATTGGYALRPRDGRDVVVLAPPLDDAPGALLALLADGAAWSTSALALALGSSQRSVQRTLAVLERDGRVRPVGRARARRWLAPPLADFTTILLLPAVMPDA